VNCADADMVERTVMLNNKSWSAQAQSVLRREAE
jgi:hypothetical protein